MAQHFSGLFSFVRDDERRARRRIVRPPDRPTRQVAQAHWRNAESAARQGARVIQMVQEAIARIRRYDVAVWPAPLLHLQALWFHPLTLAALQGQDGAISSRLRLAGLIMAMVWVNPLTKRVCLLYNDDVLFRQQDPELMQTLARCFLPLGAQGDLERQRCYREERYSSAWRQRAINAVPVWGIMYVGDRARISLVGEYPLQALQAHWAAVHQHWLDIQPYSERATLPSIPIWREARGS